MSIGLSFFFFWINKPNILYDGFLRNCGNARKNRREKAKKKSYYVIIGCKVANLFLRHVKYNSIPDNQILHLLLF